MGPAAVSPASVARSSSAETHLPLQADRRLCRRIEIDDLVVLSPRFSGRVIDISSTGLRILTTTRMKRGEQLSFRLVGEQRTVASAVVCWCQLDSVVETRSGEILSLYQVGMELLHEPHRLPPSVDPS